MTNTSHIEVDGDRLLADLRKLATFGKFGPGVDRTAFSEPDMAARHWLQKRMAAAGLDVELDGVGNVVGRSPGAGAGVLIGSHTDSVPKGGWLDGAMGVIYGLEIARAARESRDWNTAAIDVVSFQDEEGTFLPCLGSKSLCDEIDDDAIDQASDPSGQSLRDMLARHELDGIPRTRLERTRYRAYLEAHIEQGPRLEAAAKRIGVVTAIVGIRRFRIGVKGQADHAGTTPMRMRKDAGAALIQVASQVLEGCQSNSGPDTVWNIGNVTFEPGAANVVPSGAEMLFEIRDTSPSRLDELEAKLEEVVSEEEAKGQVIFEVSQTASIAPIDMDSALGEAIATAAQSHGEESMYMPSGAGHDAMTLGRHLPTAMLFVPSIGGRSHDTAEDTSEEDILLGCRVLATAVENILRG